jgi:Tol biopolymer transport system component
VVGRRVGIVVLLVAVAAAMSGCALGLPGTPTYLTDRSVTLNAEIASDQGGLGSYRFEYGTTTAYGSSTPTRTVDFTPTIVNVSEPIGNLAPDTTYHYRVCVTDSQHTNCGGNDGDRTFTTAPAAGGRSGITFQSSRDGNFEIYVMDANGANETRLTNNAALDQLPAFSPDGKKIAFSSNRDGDQDIYVMNSDGSDVQQLTNTAGSDLGAKWEAGGVFTQRIAFWSNRDGNDEIYTMNTDGSNQERRTFNDGSDNFPAWPPQGDKINFSSDRNVNFDIFQMSFSGQFPFAIGSNPAAESEPSISPFGTAIAFHSNRDGDNEILVMGRQGQNQVALTNNTATDTSPSWSPDGGKIAFTASRGTPSRIWSMSGFGTNQVMLTPAAGGHFDTNPFWSPRFP